MGTSRRITSWTGAVGLLALVAAGAVLGAHEAAGNSPAHVRARAGPVLLSNPSAEIAAAARSGTAAASELLADAVLPPRATVLATGPTASLQGEPQSLLSSADQFDAHGFFAVPFAPAAIMAFVRQHLLPGENANGPQMEPPSGGASVLVDLVGRGAHLQEGAVVYEAVPRGNGAALRVDAMVVWNPTRPADERAPATGSVLVTGYETSSLSQYPTGPVTVRVTGARAARLRRAFDALPLTSGTGCMESETAYTLRFFTADGAAPVTQVTADTCPSPGMLAVRSGSTRMASLLGNCAFLRLVAADLPAHTARYTHDRAAGCAPGTAG